MYEIQNKIMQFNNLFAHKSQFKNVFESFEN